MTWSLRDDQIDDLAFYQSWIGTETPICMNLNDPGTGKTPSVIVNQYRRALQGMRTVWVMPKSLIGKNKVEILRFSNFEEKHIAVLDGSTAKIAEEYCDPNKAVYLVNGNRFGTMVQDGAFHGIDAIDVDELHMLFKGHSSARTDAFHKVAHGASEGVLMTGSLLDGGLNPAWPAIHAVDPRYYPMGASSFRDQHEVYDDYGKRSGWMHHAKIGAILQRHAVRRSFKSIHGDQAVVPLTVWTEMTGLQKEYYEQFEEAAYIELDNYFISGELPGVAYNMTNAIMDHPHSIRWEGQELDLTQGQDTGKDIQLRAIVSELHANREPFLLYSSRVAQQKRIRDICENEGLRVGFLNGDASLARRSKVDQLFVAGELDCIVASPKVAAVGFNWQFCGGKEVCHVINASLPYLDSDYTQGYKRAIRGPRSKPLIVRTLAYPFTNDVKLMHKLEYKSMQAHLVDPSYERVYFDKREPKIVLS